MANPSTVQCVGFIMDGNRRWAEKNGKKTFEGHLAGYVVLKEMIRAVHRAQIPHMVCYAFSTENWNRAQEEVLFLTDLMRKGLRELQEESEGKKLNYRVIGQITKLPADLQEEISRLHARNQTDAELTVWIALSYGGRAEILEAVNRAVEVGIGVTEESFSSLLSTAGMPDPDIIIRTSGELRLSNFLPWQSAYSELFFTDTLWPDFGEVEFQSMVEEYGQRHRRKGT